MEGDIRTHHLLTPFLGVDLIALPALAQPSQPTASPIRTDAGGWITHLQPDQWRASDLEGLNVYSSNNADKIGSIDGLIFDSSGRVQMVVIAVGGYLGLGERDIAVPFSQIRFETQPRGTATGTTTGEARLAGTNPEGGTVALPAAAGTATVPVGNSPAAPSTPTSARSGSIPNHAVLMMSVTKDELRTAPEFRISR